MPPPYKCSFNAEEFLLFAQTHVHDLALQEKYWDALLAVPLAGISKDRKQGAVEVMDALIEESLFTCKLIDGYFCEGEKILEIGGGLGLVNAWLQTKGYDIVSLEPSSSGHPSFFELGQAVLTRLKLNTSCWLPLGVEEVHTLNRKFDLIFSNNVVEHLDDCERSLGAIAKSLKEAGRMRHHFPNYFFPFEPHFGIPLVPGFPKLTECLLPRLKKSDLWMHLNFMSAQRFRRMSQKVNFVVEFDPILFQTFQRFDTDIPFGQRHPFLKRVYFLMKKLGIMRILEKFPPQWLTPLVVTSFWRKTS